MFPRIPVVLVAVTTLWAGIASAAPDTPSVTLENRAELVAARMSEGESYDRATRAVPLPPDERTEQIQAEMSRGSTYRDARVSTSEPAEVVNARWNRHIAAMVDGGSHEAGWAASTR